MNYVELTARSAAEIILNSKDPVVVMHKNPDADAVGTATALILVLRELGKNAAYACTDSIPKRLEFIIKDLPSAEDFKNRTVITADIASPKQMGDLEYQLGEISLMIDHHEVGEPFAPNYIKKGASSSAEVLYGIIEVLEEMGKLSLTKEIAEALYAAISSDTGSFKYSSVTPSTLRIAARLLEFGIDHADIAHRLFSQKTRSQMLAEAYVASNIKTLLDGRIAYVTHSPEVRAEIGCTEDDFECAIDVVRELEGVRVALVARKTDRGGIRASLRSVGENVAEVAKMFGGGGHVCAAGCSPDAKDERAAAEMIISELVKLF